MTLAVKLVVGLGNPGRKYKGTRHNIGWHVLGQLADRYGTAAPKARFRGETVDADLDGQRAVLLCPTTYMNRSGISVAEAIRFFKIESEHLLVVCDDLNLPTGKLRLRRAGSSGGQKGLQDIIRHLGDDAFARLRIGIGRPPDRWDPADYVLSKFGKDEKEEIAEAVDQAMACVVDWARLDLETCMNRYN